MSFIVQDVYEPDKQRFWSKVNKDGPISGLGTPCWNWTGACSGGYGLFYIIGGNGKYLMAHKVSYEIKYGSIPKGLELDHLCYNKSCINPDHLEAVTHIVNMQRRLPFRGQSIYCKHGHIFDYIYRGKRYCRACARQRALAQAKAKREAKEKCPI